MVFRTYLKHWIVELADEFKTRIRPDSYEVQDELMAKTRLLRQFGPQLGRPNIDTLNGSKHANMKELRFKAADGVLRVAFAFDPERKAVILVAGDKSGGSERQFYKDLIDKADARFDAHLARFKDEKKQRK